MKKPEIKTMEVINATDYLFAPQKTLQQDSSSMWPFQNIGNINQLITSHSNNKELYEF